MTYPYDERMDKLNVILAVNDKAEKKAALKDFIREEEIILSRLSPPETNSAALNTARSSLQNLFLAFSQSSLFLSSMVLTPAAIPPRLINGNEERSFNLS